MDYEPEYYGEFVVRATQDSGTEEWTYLALVFEPHAVHLREWNADAVTELASETTDITHEQNEWCQARVEFSGADHKTVKVYQGEPGSTLDLVFEATTTLEAGGRLGFGMGVASAALGGWHFKELAAQTPATGDTYGVQVRYFYDALGRLVERVVQPDGESPQTVYYYYDGDRLVEEVDGSGNVVASYVYGQYVDEVLQMQRNTDADPDLETYTYLHDDLFNVVGIAALNASGETYMVERYEYGDFGMPAFYDGAGAALLDNGQPAVQSLVENPFLFTGRRWEPHGQLYDYRSRFMDPQTGRFLRRDTIGLYGDPANLGNPYTYCGNNPWSGVDPWGEDGLGGPIDAYRHYKETCDPGYGLSNKARRKLGLPIEDPFEKGGEKEKWVYGDYSEAVLDGTKDSETPEIGRTKAGAGYQSAASFAVKKVENAVELSLALGTLPMDGTVLVPVNLLYLVADSADGDINWVATGLMVADVAGRLTRVEGPKQLTFSFIDDSGEPIVYLYQKVGPKGEHLKYGVTSTPATRYSSRELGRGRLKILAKGKREDMLELERTIHETLPLGPEEGQTIYVEIQKRKGLKPPPYGK